MLCYRHIEYADYNLYIFYVEIYYFLTIQLTYNLTFLTVTICGMLINMLDVIYYIAGFFKVIISL